MESRFFIFCDKGRVFSLTTLSFQLFFSLHFYFFPFPFSFLIILPIFGAEIIH